MTDPVDELAEIRERKKLLSEREKELREIILCDEGVRTGLSYVARVSEQTTTKTDWKELAISLGATQPEIDKFSSETTIQVVRLARLRKRPKLPMEVDQKSILRKLTSGKLALLDVETTGLYPYAGDRVIQLAILPVTIDNLGSCSEGNAYSTFINPLGRKSHPDARLRHKINDSQLIFAPTFEDICETFMKLIEEHTLIVHNADFDLDFLFCELDRLGREPLANDAICTLSLAQSLWPRTKCKLEDLIQKFDVACEHEKLHDALNDVRALAALLPHFIATMQTRSQCDAVPD